MHWIRLIVPHLLFISPSQGGLTAAGLILCLAIVPGTAAAAEEPGAASTGRSAMPDTARAGARTSTGTTAVTTTRGATGDSLLVRELNAPDSLSAGAADSSAARAAERNGQAGADSTAEEREVPFSPPEVPYPRPFGVGESLTFSIQYGPVKAGNAVLEVEALEQVGDQVCYRIASTTRSNSVFSVFYKVRDRIVSLIDVRHLLAQRTAKDLSEGDYRLNQVVEWEQSAGLVRYDDGTVRDIEPGSRDVLGAMYYIRALPLSVGDSIPVPVHDNKKSYPLLIEVTGEETIDTPLGRFDCWKVEPKLQSAGLFQRSGSLTVWLTRDDERLPVMMQSAIKVGSVSAILIEMERGDRTVTGFGLNAN